VLIVALLVKNFFVRGTSRLNLFMSACIRASALLYAVVSVAFRAESAFVKAVVNDPLKDVSAALYDEVTAASAA